MIFMWKKRKSKMEFRYYKMIEGIPIIALLGEKWILLSWTGGFNDWGNRLSFFRKTIFHYSTKLSTYNK